MKTIFLSAMFTACCGLFSSVGLAQKEPSTNRKNEEIIIRKNNEDPQKMIIEIDSNKITVNGKPLADFNGDITVMRRNLMGGNGNNFFRMSPGNLNIFSTSNQAFLGVLTAKTDKGAIIKNVIDESAAKKAGLKNDDIITKFGDKIITSPDDLRNAVQSYKPGDKVTVNYLRDGRNKSVTLELGKNPGMSITYNIDSLRDMMNGFNPGNNFNFRMPHQNFDFNFNSNQPKLGLKIEDTEAGNGAKVLEVEQGSAADKAGLKKGDVITQINGEKVTGVNDIRSEMRQSENKNDYKIKAKRENNEMNFDVKIPKILKSIQI
ncbi:MAG TPA: PDZ domain-containing protein [Hanamia sp.]|jgi:serine protease Do|nr:PDZ domain-containing protein [Hanamia sp.]